MENRLANIISIIFHPVFIPLYAIAIVFHSPIYVIYKLPPEAQSATYVIIAIFTLIMPISSTWLLYKMGGISSIYLTDQNERRFPFIMSAIFYATAYFTLKQVGFPSLIINILLGASISILILLLFNYFQKTSAHMVGIGGLFGVVYAVSEIYLINTSSYLIPVILVCGIVAYARLRLNTHKPIEVYIGLLIGFLSEYLIQWY